MPDIVIRPDRVVERPLPSPPGHGWSQAVELNTDVSLRRYLRLLGRRKWALILSVVIFPVLAYFGAMLLPPKYTATTTVMVSPQQFHMNDVQGTVSATLPESSVTVMSNQIEILRSLGIADRVVQQTGLMTNPEFNPALRPPGRFDPLFATLGNEFRDLLRSLGFDVPQPQPVAAGSDQERLETIGAFQRALDVRVRGTSGALEISFTSRDPELARVVADALAESFIVDKLQSNFDAVTRASQWLNERTATLREGVAAAERAVEDYRASLGLVTGVTSNLATEQISQLNNELVTAQAALAQAEARLNQIRAAGGSRATAPEVLQSPVIQQLRGQEALLRSTEAQLAVRLASNHPRLVEVRSQLADVQRSIGAEVARISAATASEVSAARARIAALQSNLAEMRRVTMRNNEAEVTLRALQREAETRRNVLQQTLALSNQVSQQSNIGGPTTRILSRAALPLSPSFPNKKMFAGAAFVFAIVFGLLLIFIKELLNQTFRSGDEVESVLGIPCLTLIPRVRRQGGMATVYDYVLKNPLSQFAEAIRTLRTSLWLQDSRPKSVVITSSRPREGKTMVAISLTRLAALSGERVILVDCDIRQPSVMKAFGETERTGLFNVLSGEAALEDVIRKDHATDLHYITSGTLKANSARLMMADAMSEVLDRLRDHYDLVVMDSPPTLAMTDAQIVSNTADAVVYCVHWRSVARSTVLNGIKMLVASRANLIGTCLTKVDVKTHAKAGYLDSENYHPQYRNYYLK